MSAPLVSVVITSYNYAQYIKCAIESALTQDYPAIEVVVTDNGSTDNTMDVLAQFRNDSRVRVNVNPTNIGITRNINKGITLANGEYVVILSADDFLLPSHASRLVRIAEEHPEIGMVYGSAYFAEMTGVPNMVRNVLGQVTASYVGGRNEFPWLLAACYVCLPTALFRKRLFDTYGLLDESLDIASDWEICLRFAAGDERFAYTATPVAAVRSHPDQRSGQSYQRSGEELRESLEICERYLVPEHFKRFHGYEDTIGFGNRDRYNRFCEAGADKLMPDLDARAKALEARLAGYLRSAPAVADPKVAFVVTTTGRTVALLRALESIEKQTHGNWEAIVVQDDGFELEPLVAMRPMAKRMRYVRTAGTLGPPGARRIGYMLADADYIAFLDDDDEIGPDHIETLLDALRENGTRAACAATRNAFESYFPKTVGMRVVAHSDQLRPTHPTRADLEVAPCIPLGSVLFATSLLDQLRIFDERFGLLADWELLLRAQRFSACAPTGRRTFIEHVALGLEHQELGKRFPSYLPSLDFVYATHPPTTVDALQRRARHRERIVPFVTRPPASYTDVTELALLYGALGGLEVASAAIA